MVKTGKQSDLLCWRMVANQKPVDSSKVIPSSNSSFSPANASVHPAGNPSTSTTPKPMGKSAWSKDGRAASAFARALSLSPNSCPDTSLGVIRPQVIHKSLHACS